MYEVNAEVREEKITKASRNALRKSGRVPAVFYNSNGNSQAISVDEKEVMTLLKKRGASGIIDLSIKNGEKTETCTAMFMNLQFDYLRTHIIHLDFMRTEESKTLKIKVPIKSTGIPYGVLRQGGVLQQNAQEATIFCIPANVPDFIQIDVSEMKLNEVVRARDVQGYEFKLPMQSFFTVASSRAARKIQATQKK